MSGQIIAAFVAGVTFLAALLAIGCYIAFRKSRRAIPQESMFIFRVVLALAGAGFGAILPGFLEIQGRLLEWGLRAGGSLAVFLVVYRINPPSLVRKGLAGPRKPIKRQVPETLIEEDKTAQRKRK